MSKKILTLLLLLGSSTVIFAAEQKNESIANQKRTTEKKGTKKAAGTTKKTASSFFPTPPIANMLPFELLGGMLYILYRYNTYLSFTMALSLIAISGFSIAFFEVISYQASMMKTKAKKKELSNSFYHTLIAGLIRLTVNIGFEIVGIASFYVGHFGLKGMKGTSLNFIQNVGTKCYAIIFLLIATGLFFSPAVAIYFFFLRPKRKKRRVEASAIN